ncbi:class I SAM-dependent methyltransferase [Nocardioides alkalitolerans]|uniref:class I SAM-dependent methyltransferase n=1 Tax=Nocardioides alkalitolerans TaxID=281714 RepID=UPI00048C2668|nr:class I SAM-dependent methyltransferase [Nocardioides alkalitolerans]
MSAHDHVAGHESGHGHANGHGHGGLPLTDDEQSLGELADMLDLDGAVLAPYLAEVVDWVHAEAEGLPRRALLDLGAGTGTGSVALAERFADASVYAADRWRTMLSRVRARAERAGVDDRVRTVQADVDQEFPALEVVGLDVVWASLMAHELTHPERVLRDAREALRPGGLLVVVEMDGLPRFLPGDDEERWHAALRTGEHGVASSHAVDWAPVLTSVGFDDVTVRRFDLRAAEGADLPRYARGYLRIVRPTLAERLDPDDLATLDGLLDDDGPASVLRRTDLALRGGRTVWLARR